MAKCLNVLVFLFAFSCQALAGGRTYGCEELFTPLPERIERATSEVLNRRTEHALNLLGASKNFPILRGKLLRKTRDEKLSDRIVLVLTPLLLAWPRSDVLNGWSQIYRSLASNPRQSTPSLYLHAAYLLNALFEKGVKSPSQIQKALRLRSEVERATSERVPFFIGQKEASALLKPAGNMTVHHTLGAMAATRTPVPDTLFNLAGTIAYKYVAKYGKESSPEIIDIMVSAAARSHLPLRGETSEILLATFDRVIHHPMMPELLSGRSPHLISAAFLTAAVVQNSSLSEDIALENAAQTFHRFVSSGVAVDEAAYLAFLLTR